MSTSAVSNLSGSNVPSILTSSAKNLSVQTGQSNSVGSSSPSIQSRPDNSQLSPFAQVLSSLQDLQQSDPAKYKDVTGQIATNLQDAANLAHSLGHTAAEAELTQLSSDFASASQTGQLPNIQDLAQLFANTQGSAQGQRAQAQSTQGHHGHHRHDVSSGGGEVPATSTAPSTSARPSTIAKVSANTSPSTTAKPSTSTTPSTDVKPSTSTTPGTDVKPSTSATPSTDVKPGTSSTPGTDVKPSTSASPTSNASPSPSASPSPASSDPASSNLPGSDTLAFTVTSFRSNDPGAGQLPGASAIAGPTGNAAFNQLLAALQAFGAPPRLDALNGSSIIINTFSISISYGGSYSASSGANPPAAAKPLALVA